MTTNKRLGRGLEALLGPRSLEEAAEKGMLREVAVSAIVPNPWQPRREFKPEALQELADSIKSSGLLQPPVVRPAGSGFELIAGERRWRAVQQLGWARIPVMVREVDDQAALTLALIENLQRDDLSAIDTALGYQQLMGEFGIAQAEVARLVGRDRSTVSNTLRLLKLPERLQKLLRTGELSEGHARALLGVAEPARQVELANQAIAEGWSVRQMEREAQLGGTAAPATARASMMKKSPERAPASADARRVEEVLRQRLGTDVRLTAKRRGRGTLSISYYTNDDLTRVLELILGEPYQG